MDKNKLSYREFLHRIKNGAREFYGNVLLPYGFDEYWTERYLQTIPGTEMSRFYEAAIF